MSDPRTSDIARATAWFLTALLFTCFVAIPIAEQEPAGQQVREAVYGDRPFGLPWQVVHIAVCALMVAPLPMLVVGAIRLQHAAAPPGTSPPVSLLGIAEAYWSTRTSPDLQPLRLRVRIGTLWYVAVFVWWIVLTSILGV